MIKDSSDGPGPLLPWSAELALVCFDPVATQAAGTAQFRWPFPTEDALTNAHYLNAMQQAWKAIEVYRKPPASWDKDDLAYNNWVYDDGEL